MNASCTTHVVGDESEAVLRFIFQNNRGKKPTNLEIIKAKFIRNLHLHAPAEDRQSLLSEITGRFEDIYRSISKIEWAVDEDDVLNYTIKVYRNSLVDVTSTTFVEKELAKADDCVSFIKDFSQRLSECFCRVNDFLDKEKDSIIFHELHISAYKGIMYPFIIKALSKGMPQKELEALARALEQIFLRHWIIGTRADLAARLEDCYQEMEKGAEHVVGCIRWMKSTKDYWWSYWSDDELRRSLKGWMYHEPAKVLLWKYENHLRQCGESGYKPVRYDSIEHPHLEHIAPQTENQEPDSGYCPYDEEFKNECLECLGNYLLLSGSHNMSLSNARFQTKRERYTELKQQREVQEMMEQDLLWDKEKIRQRHEKIVAYLMSVL